MKFDPHIHHHHSIRQKDEDVSQSGVYFVTLVTEEHADLFGEITDGVMCLSRIGEITRSAWLRLADLFPVRLDEWVIMPNHLHAILWVLDLSKAEASADMDLWNPWRSLREAAPQRQASGTKSGSMRAIIQNFKSVSARKINQCCRDELASIYDTASLHGMANGAHERARRIWKSNYYEQIVHNQAELDHFRLYIADNPHKWVEDQENPEGSG